MGKPPVESIARNAARGLKDSVGESDEQPTQKVKLSQDLVAAQTNVCATGGATF
jgi:hypothetical protein